MEYANALPSGNQTPFSLCLSPTNTITISPTLLFMIKYSYFLYTK